MRRRVKETNMADIITRIDSFGTSAFHSGDGPDRRTVQTCKANGVPVSHTSRQIVCFRNSMDSYKEVGING